MSAFPKLRLNRSRRGNRGAVLIISLIVLVAMTLGGLAIMRSVDTTTLIAGNLAFKQSALYAADVNVTAAMTWLVNNKGSLSTDNPSQGYFSSSANFDWTNNATWSANESGVTTDAANNRISYLIHRLCTCANTAYNGTCPDTTANQCAIDIPTTTTAPKAAEGDSSASGAIVFATSGRVYYRVTVKSVGPRNSESYIQSMVTIPI